MNVLAFNFEWLGMLLTCGLPVLLIVLGIVAGTLVESAHLKRLDRAEHALMTIPISDVKQVPNVPGIENAGSASLVTGSVVLATDYFRTFTATLKKLIGGEIGFYERLMWRARREAICRLLAQAHQLNAVAVINIRLETSNIGSMARNPSPMVEVIAYGTALIPRAAEPTKPPLAQR